MMAETLKAADMLAAKGVSVEVVSFHTVKPLDVDYLQEATKRFKLIASVEEHSRIGGLGSAVAEWRMSHHYKIDQISFGTDDVFMHEVGSQAYARNKFGLTAEKMAETTLATYRGYIR
jgi:transketolase